MSLCKSRSDKFNLGVETDDTCRYKAGVERLIIHIIMVFGVSRPGLSSRSRMAGESQRKRLAWIFILAQGWGWGGVGVGDLHIVRVSRRHQKEGAPRLSYQLAQTGSTE